MHLSVTSTVLRLPIALQDDCSKKVWIVFFMWWSQEVVSNPHNIVPKGFPVVDFVPPYGR